MAEEKSLVLAMILSFVFCIGNIINGLTIRAIVSLIIYFLLALLGALTMVTAILVPIFWVYVLYDTYECNKAVNEGTELPKFLFFIDLD